MLAAPLAGSQSVPGGFEHQGYIEVNEAPFNSNGAFRFALVDGSGNNVWTNDGSELGTTNMPASAVALTVSDGIYAVSLGDGTTTDAFPANLFTNNSDLRLRVWFDDGTNGVQQLSPDKPVRSVPYAQRAASADMAEAVPNVITVDRVEYNAPREHYLMVPAEEFIPNDQGEDYNVGPTGITSSLAPSLFTTGIQFPDGCTVTEMTFFFEDIDADSEVEVTLNQTEPRTGANTSVATVTTNSGGADGEGEASTSADLDPALEIDNSQFLYRLVAFDSSADWDSGDMYLRAIRFAYTLSEAR